MIQKSALAILALAFILIFTGRARADLDCSTVAEGSVPVSFTFNSLIEHTEEPHGKMVLFYEESVWDLGGELLGAFCN